MTDIEALAEAQRRLEQAFYNSEKVCALSAWRRWRYRKGEGRMAHLETQWKCPGCHCWWNSKNKAQSCAVSHVYSAVWAVGKHKSVLTNGANTAWALRESDLSDFIDEREKQLNGIKY